MTDPYTQRSRHAAPPPGAWQQFPPEPQLTSADYYRQYSQQGMRPHQQAVKPPRRKRRVFLWVFLAVQALFIIWIIAAVATKPGGQTVASQVAQACRNGGWQGLFKSQADCTQHYAVALNDASNTGKGIGVAIVVVIWVVVDFFLGVGYGVYKLATR